METEKRKSLTPREGMILLLLTGSHIRLACGRFLVAVDISDKKAPFYLHSVRGCDWYEQAEINDLKLIDYLNHQNENN
jgi:hypothetical protein